MKISLGGAVSVTATERWLSEIRAGQAFMGGTTEAAGGVGTFTLVQLFNPAASGKNGLVLEAVLRKATVGQIRVEHHTAVLGASLTQEGNLLLAGAAPALDFRSGNVAAATGTLIGNILIEANIPLRIPHNWWMEIPAGRGIHFRNDTANEALEFTLYWIEI